MHEPSTIWSYCPVTQWNSFNRKGLHLAALWKGNILLKEAVLGGEGKMPNPSSEAWCTSTGQCHRHCQRNPNQWEAMWETEDVAGSILSLKQSIGPRTAIFLVIPDNIISPPYYTMNSWREEGTEYFLEHWRECFWRGRTGFELLFWHLEKSPGFWVKASTTEMWILWM